MLEDANEVVPPPRVVRVGPDDELARVVDDPGAGGTYVLVFELASPTHIEVGALGACTFPAGDYAYVGSAFGSGGFGRTERHRRKLGGEGDTVHWHVDALTTHPETSFVVAHLVPELAVECAVARRLPPGPLDGFGSSDCGCRSHLALVGREAVEDAVRTAVEPDGSS
jgi:endonuclease-3